MTLRQWIKRFLAPIGRPLQTAWHWLTGLSWKQALLGLTVLAVLFAGGGFLYAWSGLVPIAASSGHWAITSWVLGFTMRNAVETHSLGTQVPPLDDPALVLKGAGHYATGCAACHGAPGEARSLIVQQMTPKPPFLPPMISEWTPAQLFWIVKNGIKFTAMPAWPALQREDEVWAMVAFLQQLPALTSEQYERLAYGERANAGSGADATPDHLRPLAEPLGPALANCVRCHRADGAGRGRGAFPKLADQTEAYLLASLQAFAKGERFSGIMQPIAAGLSEDTMRALAGYYADQAGFGVPPAPTDAPDAIARGKAIAEQGVPEQGIPSCADCHGPKQAPRNPIYPKLAGQYAGYLALQLELFKAGKRGGTPYAHIMQSIAKRLSAEQIRDLAAYYASLGGPARRPR
jgi:cytochrome c553